jgi:cell division protein FtsN
MESKPRFYIYERKEILILICIGILMAVFFFTLGLHLGKKTISAKSVQKNDQQSYELKTEEDRTPPPEELSEQTPKVGLALEQYAQEALKSEVAETGIVLDQPIQVDLPKQKKSASSSGGGEKVPAKFTLQVGSYPNMEEANRVAQSLSLTGHSTVVQKVDLGAKGTRYRVFLGGFLDIPSATAEGARLKAEEKISAFLVIPIQSGVKK